METRQASPKADDDILRRIERFHFVRGPVRAERRNRGYSLNHADAGVPVARPLPTGRDDRVEILYWSSWKEKWAPMRTVLIIAMMLVGALFILASYKSRTGLDVPLLSNNTKFVIGFLLIFGGIFFAVIVFLIGGFK